MTTENLQSNYRPYRATKLKARRRTEFTFEGSAFVVVEGPCDWEAYKVEAGGLEMFVGFLLDLGETRPLFTACADYWILRGYSVGRSV